MLGIGRVAVAAAPQAGQQIRGSQAAQPMPAAARFLQPIAKCDMSLTDLIGKFCVFFFCFGGFVILFFIQVNYRKIHGLYHLVKDH